MPRKKTTQPDPINTYIGSGVIVEVHDKDSWPIGRGQHMSYKHQEWFSEVLAWAAEQYLTPKGRKRIAADDDFLKSFPEFDHALQATSLYPIEGDNSSVRKLYPKVKAHIRALETCIAENNQKTPRRGTSRTTNSKHP
jgi:hypothetical protein